MEGKSHSDLNRSQGWASGLKHRIFVDTGEARQYGDLLERKSFIHQRLRDDLSQARLLHGKVLAVGFTRAPTQPAELLIHGRSLARWNHTQLMRSLNERLHRNAPLSFKVGEPSHCQVAELGSYHLCWHQKLGGKTVSVFFWMITDVGRMHTQVPCLMRESPSLPVSWPIAIQQYHRMIIDPLRQAVDTRSAEVFRKDDATSRFQPAGEVANWSDRHAPLHPKKPRGISWRGPLRIERRNNLICL
jgi:hypothetical protein